MSNPMTYAEEQVLKAYRKDEAARPGNLPQGQKATTRMLTPTPKETAEYHYAVSQSELRGYESDSEKYLIARYEHLYTDKRIG